MNVFTIVAQTVGQSKFVQTGLPAYMVGMAEISSASMSDLDASAKPFDSADDGNVVGRVFQVDFKSRVGFVGGNNVDDAAGYQLQAFDQKVFVEAQNIEAVARRGLAVVDEDGVAIIQHAFHRVAFD